MVWRFLKHYGTGKAAEVLNEFTQAVVTFDPETASRAQISMMEAELHKLGQRLAEAEAEVRREHQETQQIRRTYEEHLEAARHLQAELDDIQDAERKAQVESSLHRLVDRLEELQAELDREQKEDEEVEAWSAELRQSFDELARKLKDSRSQLQSARREMETAQLRKRRAEERAGRRGMGLADALSTVSVALEAMNSETARVRAETDAMGRVAQAMSTDRLSDDSHIAEALAKARDKPRGVGDASERLKRLAG